MARKPLAGKTIVVTRPRAQAAALARALRAAGARAIVAPTIKIAPPASYRELDSAIRGYATRDAVIFTSRNAVDSFFGRAAKLRLKGLPRPKRLYAVGAATAAALAARRWRGARLPDRFRGEELAKAMGEVRGWRVLMPCSQIARGQLARLLRRRGAAVLRAQAYRTLPDESAAARLKAAAREGIDAVLFASGSAVGQFWDQLGPAACARLFKTAAAAAIGPVTSSALRARGVKAVVEPKAATARALLRALKEHFKGAKP
jgi:uroporphyrinogen III methyltransferase/synthase